MKLRIDVDARVDAHTAMPASGMQLTSINQLRDAATSCVPSFPTVNIKLSGDLSDIFKIRSTDRQNQSGRRAFVSLMRPVW